MTPSSTISSASSSNVAIGLTPETAVNLSVSSAVPSASSSSDSSGSRVGAGAIVGGVGAGIIIVAVFGFAAAFLVVSVSDP